LKTRSRMVCSAKGIVFRLASKLLMDSPQVKGGGS
jgi:hypothetical protein